MFQCVASDSKKEKYGLFVEILKYFLQQLESKMFTFSLYEYNICVFIAFYLTASWINNLCFLVPIYERQQFLWF